MKDFSGKSASRPKARTIERPPGMPDHSCYSTLELVQVSPDKFLQLEEGRKYRKKRVSLAPNPFERG